MERLGKPLVKIIPRDFVTLRECVIASFEANGPMTREQLYRSLPMHNRVQIRRMALTLPDEVTGR